MSNVLIGIIGVILFIGLALAGALFLGPRFQESRVNALAGAYASQLQQINAAIDMYEVDKGERMLASTYQTNMAVLQTGYLKTAPVNPVRPSFPYYTPDVDGTSSATPVDHVYTSAGTDAYARSICIAMERQAGSSDPEGAVAEISDIADALKSHKRIGCFHYRDGQYYPFIRR